MTFMVSWIGADFSAWNLTTGYEGAQLKGGVTGFDDPEFTAFWTERIGDGDRFRGTRLGRRTLNLPVVVGKGQTGMAWRTLDRAWWRSLSRNNPGTLIVTTEDAAGRFILLRLDRSSSSEVDFDPALTGFRKYLITVVSDSPFWRSADLVETWMFTPAGQNFYGGGAVMFDNFGRTVSSGWGVSDSGHVWTTSGGSTSDYSVTGTMGQHSLGSVNVSRWSVLDVSQADCDITLTVATDALATGGSHFLHLAGRLANTDNCYLARVEFDTAQGVALTLRKRVSGTETLLATAPATGLTHAAGTRFGLRLRVAGSALSAKVWLASGAEPTTWNVTATDTGLTAAGDVGVRSLLSAANTNTLPVLATYDDLVTGGTAPPYYLSASSGFGESLVTNPGDVPAWPRWKVTGPCSGATLSVDGHTIAVPQPVAAGASIYIDTESPDVFGDFLESKWDVMTGAVDFAAVPVGATVPVTAQVSQPAAGAQVTMTITPQYERAW